MQSIQDCPTRTYPAGRPIAPYRHGEEITSLSQIKTGDVIIMVSHQFEAETLVKVTSRERNTQGFDYKYMSPEGKVASVVSDMFCWDFDFEEGPASHKTLYRAIGHREE